jgi:hypothetical protein
MIETLILISLGLLLIIISFIALKRMNKTFTNGFTTEGIISHFDRKNNYNYPVVRFTTLKQEWITQKSSLSYFPGLLKKGETVKVVYDPHDPGNFYIDSKWTRITPVILIIAGLACLVLGVLSFMGKLPVST